MHRGKLSDAARLIESICKNDNDDAEAWEMMASICLRLGELEKVTDACRNLVRLRPDSAWDLFNLALAFQKTGLYKEAIASYGRVLDINPDNADAQYNIGLAFQELGQPARAVPHYRDALRLRPHWPEATNNLALSLRQQGHLASAIDVLEEAIRTSPSQAKLHYVLAETYNEDCQFDKATQVYRSRLEGEPENASIYMRIGEVLLRYGKPEAALEYYRKALRLKPDDVEIQAGMIDVYDATGDYEHACSILLPLLERNPDHPVIALRFASLCDHMNQCAEAIKSLNNLLEKRSPTPLFKIKMHFALGRLYDHRGDYELAFSHYEIANKMKPYTFDIERFSAITHALVTSYSGNRFSDLPRASCGDNSPQIVFIVGMPRSGTSLVEQIIASHSRVFGAGELDIIPRIVANMAGELGSDLPYPHCIHLLKEASLNTFARRYLEKIGRLYRAEEQIITDKMPENFLHLGLIELLFPGARIIHCKRDPLDTCLSNYFQDFSGTHHYAYDLRNLGAYYYQYKKLMSHWEKVVSLPILNISYEHLVAETETVSHSIFSFLGLDWEEQCLHFYDSGRLVTTASQKQVNKPIYESSIGRWKHYQEHLGPLIAALEHGR